MSKKLGRGLGALLGDVNQPAVEEKIKEVSNEVSIHSIRPNLSQPRTIFNEEKLKELSESLKSVGMIEPIVVSNDGEYYQIIAGERRYRAALLAGFTTVPIVIKNDLKENLLEVMLIENIQREDLSPLEEANCFVEILNKKSLTHEELAGFIGKSRSYVTNHLRLLKLPYDIQHRILSGEIPMGHAKMLVNLSEEEQQQFLVDFGKSKISVRELEKKVRDSKKDNKIKTKEKLPLHIADIEDKMRDYFQVRVSFSVNKKMGGKIEMEYYDDQDLERIVDKIFPYENK